MIYERKRTTDEEIPADRLREIVQAEKDGRLIIIEKQFICPKCKKDILTPRSDKKFYFCFTCRTEFSRQEIIGETNERVDQPFVPYSDTDQAEPCSMCVEFERNRRHLVAKGNGIYDEYIYQYCPICGRMLG